MDEKRPTGKYQYQFGCKFQLSSLSFSKFWPLLHGDQSLTKHAQSFVFPSGGRTMSGQDNMVFRYFFVVCFSSKETVICLE